MKEEPPGSAAAQPSGAALASEVAAGGDSLVDKTVWDGMLADEAFDPSHPLEGTDRGTAKRDRMTASMSSQCSDDMPQRQSFSNWGPEDLAGAIDSMDLANLYDGSKLAGQHSKPGKASLGSEDMNRLLQGGISGLSQPLSSPFSGASFSGLGMPSCQECAEGGASTWASEEGMADRPTRMRASSDQSRPLWRAILLSIDDLSASLAVETGGIAQKQAAISDFHQTMVAKMGALGEVGMLMHARLAMLMSDTGLIDGTTQPESEAQLTNTARQALASLRRYAGNAMVAPIVMPRGSCDTESEASAARKRQLSLGSSDMAGLCSSVQQQQQQQQQQLWLHQQQQQQQQPSLQMGDEGLTTGKLHACKNCQRAKTACMDQRPCPRCLRLQIECDHDAKAVKRACANCKRAKVKCDLDTEEPCGRCRRLGLLCQVHVPNKKKRPELSVGDYSTASPSPLAAFPGFAGFGPVPTAGSPLGPPGGAPVPLLLGGRLMQDGGGLAALEASIFSMPSAAAVLHQTAVLTDAFATNAGAPTPELDSLGTLEQPVDAYEQQRQVAQEEAQEEMPEMLEGLGNLDEVNYLLRMSTNSAELNNSAEFNNVLAMRTSSAVYAEYRNSNTFGSMSMSVSASMSGLPEGGMDAAGAPLEEAEAEAPPPGPVGEAPGSWLPELPLLPCPPLLPVATVLTPSEWTIEMSNRDGNARLLKLKRATADKRMLWAVVSDVPAPPALVAKGLRHMLREWEVREVREVRVKEEGSRGPLVPSVRVKSEGGEPPAWLAECGGASGQLLHAGMALPGGGNRDFVLRSVWTSSEGGACRCSMRPATSPAMPAVAGVQRSAVKADIWVRANPEKPGGAELIAVLEPGDNAESMGIGGGGAGAYQLLEWTRLVQEASILLQRDSAAPAAVAAAQ